MRSVELRFIAFLRAIDNRPYDTPCRYEEIVLLVIALRKIIDLRIKDFRFQSTKPDEQRQKKNYHSQKHQQH